MEKLIPKTFLPTLVLFNYGIIYECSLLRKYFGNFPKVKLNCKKAVNTSRFRFRCTAFVLGGKRKRKRRLEIITSFPFYFKTVIIVLFLS